MSSRGRAGYRAGSAHTGARGGDYKKGAGSNFKGGRNDDHRALYSSLKAAKRKEEEEFDIKAGYGRFSEGAPKVGYLFNMSSIELVGEDKLERSGLDMYFLQQDGSTFKATVAYEPYLYLVVSGLEVGGESRRSSAASTTFIGEREVVACLERKFEALVSTVTAVEMEDLGMANHLSGLKRRLLRVSFRCVTELMAVRKPLQGIIERNAARIAAGENLAADAATTGDPMCLLLEMREYDVPYVTRVSIDSKVFVGSWYTVTPVGSGAGAGNRGCVTLQKLDPDTFGGVPEPRILAWDIECTKAPLKFPDARVDHVYMISYMLDGVGFLLINREVVTADVSDFEYTPKPEFPGPFTVTNYANEEGVLRAFMDHVKEVRPQIFVTFNGDYFDWPFVSVRCKQYGIDMAQECGIGPVGSNGRVTDDGVGASDVEWRGRTAVHIDCMYWVKRDSYLPQGSHGLKAVTREKLNYDPVEIDPEDMLTMARDNPAHMASYSVSDAVATYYLYLKYIHAFVFSLSTIIPMPPDDVLRKGSGTLCESLLQVEAFDGNIVAPNKQVDAMDMRYHGHLLDSETYLGGHVECLESGVFRSDIPCSWNLVPTAFDELINKIDKALTFAVEVEYGLQRSDIANYDEVRTAIVERLEALRDHPIREEEPVIYHLDVAAMYPNIILSNRLQPQAMVTEDTCNACEFSSEPSARCKRALPWRWRGDYFPPNDREVAEALRQLRTEQNEDGTPFVDLSPALQQAALKARLKIYSQTVYKKVKETVEESRTAVVCQRENPFYVNTVRKFRDRRYDYKIATKKAQKELDAAIKGGSRLDVESAKAKYNLNDSLQLAHKCILNSFYGYVMRKGARWHSMEMAGVVTFTGSNLIQQARQLVEQVGRPLELDTDGIWCVLPKSFPQKFKFKRVNGGTVDIIYPCVMLNADVHERYTNDQYQDLANKETRTYAIRSECSIFFELDGPYAAMVLPASPDEGRLLKKRYAVFEDNGELAELKGFELKRRGELQMIKVFQQQAFGRFLEGTTLESCYGAVSEVANYWLDVLDTQGEDLSEEDIIELLSEKRSMTQKLEDYGTQKSMAISTAKRLAEFLGAEMVKDKGLACKLLVAKKPAGEPVTDRAIPAAIFQADEAKRRTFLRKWLKDSSMVDFDIRSILDWDYYRTRIAGTIQKIITIPAAYQRVPNPVPRVAHPEWLAREIAADKSSFKQVKMDGFLSRGVARSADQGVSSQVIASTQPRGSQAVADMEDVQKSVMPGNEPKATTSAGNFIKLGRVHLHVSAAVDALAKVGLDDGKASDAKEADKEAFEDEDESLPAPPLSPSMSPEELQEWLASRKRFWRALRAQNKDKLRLAKGVAGAGVRGAKGKKGTAAALDLAIKSPSVTSRSGQEAGSMGAVPGLGYLQIVEIRSNRQKPGEFIMWAFTAPRRLQPIRLSVDRKLYVNMTQPLPADSSVAPFATGAVDKRLPHDAPSLHLYEIKISERRFLRNLHAVRRCFDEPDIVAVYESRTPLLFRALADAGCVMQLDPARRNEMMEAAGHKSSDGSRAGFGIVNGKFALPAPSRQRQPGQVNKVSSKKSVGQKQHTKQAYLSFAGQSKDMQVSTSVSNEKAPVDDVGASAVSPKFSAAATSPGHARSLSAPVETVMQGAGLVIMGDDGSMQLLPELTSESLSNFPVERSASVTTVVTEHNVHAGVLSAHIDLSESNKDNGVSDDAVAAAQALEAAKKARRQSKAANSSILAGKRKVAVPVNIVAQVMRQAVGSQLSGAFLGSAAAFSPGATAIPPAIASARFHLDDFSATTSHLHPYLDSVPTVAALTAPQTTSPVGSAVYRWALLYHSSASLGRAQGGSRPSSGSRSFTVLFLINETWSQIADSVARGLIAFERAQRHLPPNVALDPTVMSQTRDKALQFLPVMDYPATVTAHVFVLDGRVQSSTGGRKQATPEQLSRTMLDRLFDEAKQVFKCAPATVFSTRLTQVDTQAEVWRRVSSLIRDLLPESSPRNAPLLVAVAVPFAQNTLLDLVPSLDGAPVIKMSYPGADCDYPALNWADRAASNGIARFFHALREWDWKVRNARYISVPVGNMADISALAAAGSDVTDPFGAAVNTTVGKVDGSMVHVGASDDTLGGIADLMFARTLAFNGHVLWATTRAVPDLGGSEADAAMASSASVMLQLQSAMASSGHESRRPGQGLVISTGQARSHNPILDVPGCYRTVVISLGVQNLAVNTILNSSHMNDVAGGGDDDAFLAAAEEAAVRATDAPGVRSNINAVNRAAGLSGGTESCLHAYRALRKLVSEWHSAMEKLALPKQMLVRLYAWLASPASLLHDPALHRLVHGLMRRCHELLLRAVRNAGLTVLHASFERIIVATGRLTAEAGINAVSAAVARISAQPVFRNLDLPLLEGWQTLLWYDSANFTGVPLAEADVPREGHEGKKAIDDDWAMQIIRRCVEKARISGDGLGKDDWRDIRLRYMKDAKARVREVSRWAMCDAMPDDTALAFQKLLAMFVTRSTLERAGRGLDRIQARFTASVESALVSAVQLGSGPAQALLLRLRHFDGAPTDDEDLSAVQNNQKASSLARKRSRTSDEEDEEDAQLSDLEDVAVLVVPTSSRSSPASAQAGGGPPMTPAVVHSSGEHQTTPNSGGSTAMGLQHVLALLSPVAESRAEEVREATDDSAFIVRLVQDTITKKAVDAIDVMDKHWLRTGGSEERGSGRPSAAFVRALCHMLTLDSAAAEAAHLLRMNLSPLVMLRESESAWDSRAATASFALPDVVCRHCHTVRDLDLLREAPVESDSASPRWACNSCSHAYDSDEIECSLVAVAEYHSLSHQTQDLVCAKCKRVRSSQTRRFCECSGAYVASITPASLQASMATLQRIATQYGFLWLGETVNWLLGGGAGPRT